MAVYSYEARSAEGKTVTGEMDVVNQNEIAHALQSQGMRVISITKKSRRKGLNSPFESIKMVDRIFFTQNLYIMIRTGFSLAKALKTLALQTTNKKFKEIILTLQGDVEKGITLSQSMKKYPKVFNELFINMIASGEVSGKLEDVLSQLTIQMKKDHALLAKVKSALTYPIIIVFAMIVIGIVMIVFVIPKITVVYESASAELPLPTRILMSLSDFLIHYGIYVFVVVAALIFGIYKFSRTKRGKHLFHKVMLVTPLLSPIIKKINIARFTRILSSLLKTDIPIVQTFGILERTLGNVYYKEVMADASERVKKGVNIVTIFEQYPNLFPPILIQMISVGEQSGTLELITDEIATFYEEEVDQTMSSLPSILEPVLLILIAVVAAGLVAAIILPIYNLSEAI